MGFEYQGDYEDSYRGKKIAEIVLRLFGLGYGPRTEFSYRQYGLFLDYTQISIYTRINVYTYVNMYIMHTYLYIWMDVYRYIQMYII